MKYSVYILQSELDLTFYVGYSKNVDDRLKQHNAGKSVYTSRHRPYKLIYIEEFDTEREAKERERYIKKYGNMKSFLRSRVPPNLLVRD